MNWPEEYLKSSIVKTDKRQSFKAKHVNPVLLSTCPRPRARQTVRQRGTGKTCEPNFVQSHG